MLTAYVPIFIFSALVGLLGGIALLVSILLGPSKKTKTKLTKYECGVDASESPRYRFSVTLFTLVVVFLVFEAMMLFLVPWAVAFRNVGIAGLSAMAVFVAILFVGFVHTWKKGIRQWE